MLVRASFVQNPEEYSHVEVGLLPVPKLEAVVCLG